MVLGKIYRLLSIKIDCIKRKIKFIAMFYFRSYYFSKEEVSSLFESVGFEILTCNYIQRRTINLKERIDVPRIFVQGKFKKL